MGAAQVDSFVRFYELPGAQHGPSTVFQASWDQLTSLENWVEKGIDPSNNLVSSDDVGVPGRTRPMCTYPGWPKYGGTGDINSATSFSCTLN
jgi:feruloyl esterase